MEFSERVGGRPPPKSGLEEASPELRTALWNLFHERVLPDGGYATIHKDAGRLWARLGWRKDRAPWQLDAARNEFANHWFGCDWLRFFDAVEAVVAIVSPDDDADRPEFFEVLNYILEGEGCAYRFIAEELAPLTNPAEMQEVSGAAESSIPAVATHIREALKLMPPHENANPRNSVKESISAVEAALKVLTEKPSATLTDGLDAFEKRFGALHPALSGGLKKLYAYTSDEKGVRHALVDEAANVTVDDARFMLVACSAFSNYLVALTAKSKGEP